MSIDLCNKLELTRGLGELLSWDAGSHRPSVTDAQRAAMQLAHRVQRNSVDPRTAAGDPSAWSSEFAYALDRAAIRLDQRSSEVLRADALGHPDPAMREQAFFEYADRNEDDAIELLTQVARNDGDRQIRWDALWAIEKLGGLGAVQALERFVTDPDPEIAEWARLFIGELKTSDPAFDGRGCQFTAGRTFDETIFLLIHCDLYIRLDDTNRNWGKLSLAPQGLARVYGQAHACPNVATREHKLVIAKTISGLHGDGSPHVDNYLFRGFTDRTRADRGSFFFESHVARPFYLSGRADDHSDGVVDSHIGFMRQGCWFLDPSFVVRDAPAIRYVRGRFQGWGYTNLANVAGKPLEQILAPGNAILSTLHHPVAGPMTNVFISGTFKGKLNDWDGDGKIDLNSRDVYATTEGEVDSNQDGVADQPGVACCPWHGPGL
jgi:hypothetical protein